MRRSFQWTFILGVLLALTLGVAACGGDDSGSGSESGTNQGTPAEGKQGGKLTELWTDDVGQHRSGHHVLPDGLPDQCSDAEVALQLQARRRRPTRSRISRSPIRRSPTDGKTVTVKIKSGVKFSPPVNREVTSKDVKYAIERGFFNTVNNGYAGAYFGDLAGREGRRQARQRRSRASRRPTTRRSCST